MAEQAPGPSGAAGTSSSSDLKTPLIPAESDYEKAHMGSTNLFLVFFSTGFLYVVCGAVAVYYSLWVWKGQMQIWPRLHDLAARKGGPIFFCNVLVRLCITIATAHAAYFRRAIGCNPPDQHVYRTKDSSVVLLDMKYEENGHRAYFNQAQRSYQDMMGNMPFALASFALAAYAYPLSASILLFVFAASKLAAVHASGKKASTRRSVCRTISNFAVGSLDGIVLMVGFHATYLQFGIVL